MIIINGITDACSFITNAYNAMVLNNTVISFVILVSYVGVVASAVIGAITGTQEEDN